ncbi:MAG TPA: glycosyltransferase [Acidimicrobiia bacterium]
MGKFLGNPGEKTYVRGVTYGTFQPRHDGSEYPEPAVVERDFSAMSAAGVNAVRTYTAPPRWLLDAASDAGLRVMVGLGAERYVGYLNDGRRAHGMMARVRDIVRSCAGHPAVLSYVIGNEIPASVVRWHGRRRIEHYLSRWSQAVKDEDAVTPVTYANFPSTEYLQLDFVDLLCFNVFLEAPSHLEAYLKRLQNIAGDRPLVIGELGLDSRRHGEEEQARSLHTMVTTAFEAGCAGVFVYAWTDEWHTAAGEVLDWDFGLTRRDRSPKPSLSAVSTAFKGPLPIGGAKPRVSVVVCSYQGRTRIDECLQGISRLEYPKFETIVVDDGSTDGTAEIARRYPVRVITTEHRGLGHARNVGLAAAAGDIVAYIDDDAFPDSNWLDYLVNTFQSSDHAAVGGPNIAPTDGSLFARCVENSPGNPTHILLSDDEAEHIPGCNMAFRKSHLQDVGGFDERFVAAGDDVDMCWRVMDRGWTIGFSPAAMVWHRPRSTLRTYWRQQVGYGRAEGVLERRWPEKYNAAGQASWGGRLYGSSVRPVFGGKGRIYQGVWGQASFQSIYESRRGSGSLPLTPEWYIMIATVAVLFGMSPLWRPLAAAGVVLAVAVGASLLQAVATASRTRLDLARRSRGRRLLARCIVALLHLLQPLARLWGHLRSGLTPWRQGKADSVALPFTRTWFWSEHWKSPEGWVQSMEDRLIANGSAVVRGKEFDRFDLVVSGGASGSVRLITSVEEHGGGHQLIRIRLWPHWSPLVLWGVALGGMLAAAAALDSAGVAATLLGLTALGMAARALLDCAGAAAATRRAVGQAMAGETSLPEVTSGDALTWAGVRWLDKLIPWNLRRRVQQKAESM